MDITKLLQVMKKKLSGNNTTKILVDTNSNSKYTEFLT